MSSSFTVSTSSRTESFEYNILENYKIERSCRYIQYVICNSRCKKVGSDKFFFQNMTSERLHVERRRTFSMFTMHRFYQKLKIPCITPIERHSYTLFHHRNQQIEERLVFLTTGVRMKATLTSTPPSRLFINLAFLEGVVQCCKTGLCLCSEMRSLKQISIFLAIFHQLTSSLHNPCYKKRNAILCHSIWHTTGHVDSYLKSFSQKAFRSVGFI